MRPPLLAIFVLVVALLAPNTATASTSVQYQKSRYTIQLWTYNKTKEWKASKDKDGHRGYWLVYDNPLNSNPLWFRFYSKFYLPSDNGALDDWLYCYGRVVVRGDPNGPYTGLKASVYRDRCVFKAS